MWYMLKHQLHDIWVVYAPSSSYTVQWTDNRKRATLFFSRKEALETVVTQRWPPPIVIEEYDWERIQNVEWLTAMRTAADYKSSKIIKHKHYIAVYKDKRYRY